MVTREPGAASVSEEPETVETMEALEVAEEPGVIEETEEPDSMLPEEPEVTEVTEAVEVAEEPKPEVEASLIPLTLLDAVAVVETEAAEEAPLKISEEDPSVEVADETKSVLLALPVETPLVKPVVVPVLSEVPVVIALEELGTKVDEEANDASDVANVEDRPVVPVVADEVIGSVVASRPALVVEALSEKLAEVTVAEVAGDEDVPKLSLSAESVRIESELTEVGIGTNEEEADGAPVLVIGVEEELGAIVEDESIKLLVSGTEVSKDVLGASGDAEGPTAASVVFPEAEDDTTETEALLVANSLVEANGEFRVVPEANGELERLFEELAAADVAKSSVVEAEVVWALSVWLLEVESPVSVRALSGLYQSPAVPLVDGESV